MENTTTFTKEHVTAYINSKVGAWSPSCLKSEHARLRTALPLINLGADALNTEGSKKWAPYTLKTLFIRAGELFEFVCPGVSENPFKAFLSKNAQLFKRVYERKAVSLTIEEASKRIASIERPVVRKMATFLLHSGLRAEEALSYNGSGKVVGKGGKVRPVLTKAPYPHNHGLTYSVLHKELAKVGIKPHDLRKLCATKLVEGGFKEADLLRVMGWTNIQTAAIYLQPKNDEHLSQRMQEAFAHVRTELQSA